MKTEEIIDRLRNPQKYKKLGTAIFAASSQEGEITASANRQKANLFALLITVGVLGMAAFVLFITLHAKQRAEDLAASLDPAQLQGLSSQAEFDPSKIVTYININELGEGNDRVPTVEELGATIPIISRYNYQAITPANYGVIGAAPWALSSNIEANLQDVELLRYLLNRPEVADAFVKRPDTVSLLEDPQLLAAFAQDTNSLQKFFNSTLVQQVLQNQELTLVFSKSRLMSTLLVSKAVKFYRDRPQEAAQLIQNSPVLRELAKNPSLRKAVQENHYLKAIAPQLLNQKELAAPASAGAKPSVAVKKSAANRAKK